MKDKPLKASDIAKMAGISGNEMKRITENYDTVIPSRLFGRVKLYEQKAVPIIEKISSMESSGKSPEDIIRECGGKITRKSTKERAEDNIRKNQVPGSGGKKQASISKKSTVPPPRTAGASPGADDKTAFLELKLTKLTNRVEKLEKELEDGKKARTDEREEIMKLLAAISDKLNTTGEWIDYFDGAFNEFISRQDEFNSGTIEWIDYTEEEIDLLKLPFWKKKR
ncbi:MAG: hypothetical protein JW931_07945 [Methanomicrobiaceae archaeon]|nr:hypothetical protein [Methanomicrobiaceae archaeon]